MSRSALSAKVFAVYLFVIGPVLVSAPNVLLSTFRMGATNEVWIRVVGVIAFNLGVYTWVAAKHGNRPFLAASVYTRMLTFVTFAAFAGAGLASPMLIVFGTIDLCGGLWTHAALKADAGAARSDPAGDPSLRR